MVRGVETSHWSAGGKMSSVESWWLCLSEPADTLSNSRYLARRWGIRGHVVPVWVCVRVGV